MLMPSPTRIITLKNISDAHWLIFGSSCIPAGNCSFLQLDMYIFVENTLQE